MIQLNIRDTKQLKPVTDVLKENQWLNKQKKIENHNGVFVIYTNLKSLPPILSQYDFSQYDNEPRAKISLRYCIETYYKQHGLNKLDFEIPKKWSIYPPMVLFNANTDKKYLPKALCQELLKHQVKIFGRCGITHLAINKPIIESDVMRRPFNIVPLYGDFGPELAMDHWPTEADFTNAFWCHVVQNGIYQTWAPKYTMFSRGNIKEKKRILDCYKNLDGSIVVDFYCGIGYFALSYLKNGAKVLCWEINPWSIEGFKRALQHAGYKYKIYQQDESFQIDELKNVDACLFLESNEKLLERFEHVKEKKLNIKHINLGLLPSSRPSWKTAHQLVTNKSCCETIVHLHENVHTNYIDTLKNEIEARFQESRVLYVERVKTFAPDIWHIVYDVEIK
ncbi:TRM12 [Candida oxycetoniae]|uniref:tRNA wybutosine-synthesizing protein 2 n=1 Tax=Candida oxycetoniae TaxID=497107 RepID=A0AAI9WZD3_9ASCO|nr:TRM12 [Candida oxycetoniae]KAI3406247.1 TRM12 [Candida oxycetoniae]